MSRGRQNTHSDEVWQRRGRSDVIASNAAFAAETAFKRSGFSDPSLVLRWPAIVGTQTARIAAPLKLTEAPTGAILTLRVEPAAALFLRHESRALCDRINNYFGRPLVSKIRMVQGRVTAVRRPATNPQLPSHVPASDPSREFQGAERLRDALLGLAKARIAEHKPVPD